MLPKQESKNRFRQSMQSTVDSPKCIKCLVRHLVLMTQQRAQRNVLKAVAKQWVVVSHTHALRMHAHKDTQERHTTSAIMWVCSQEQ